MDKEKIKKEWKDSTRAINPVRFFDRTSPVSVIFIVALVVLIVTAFLGILKPLMYVSIIILAAYVIYLILWLIDKLS